MNLNKLTGARAFFVLIVFTALVFNFQDAFAQKLKKKKNKDGGEKGAYDYTILRNDPENPPKLTIGICPLSWTFNALTSPINTLAFGVEGAYEINDKIGLLGNFNMAYPIPRDYGAFTGVATPLKPWSLFEIGGQYYFANQVKEKTEIVSITQIGYIHYVMKVENIKRAVRYGARLGFITLNTPVESQSATLQAYNTKDPATPVDINGEGFVTNMQSGMFFLGLCTDNVRDLRLKFDDESLGERVISVRSQFFLDALIGTGNHIDNVTFTNNNTTSIPLGEYSFDKNNQFAGFGARVGYRFLSMRNIGSYQQLEIGSLPGLSGHGFYFMYRVGLSITPQDKDR
jgi:hypothetical protein